MPTPPENDAAPHAGFDFDAETAVFARGDGSYETRLHRSWWVLRGPNGGYLAAIVLRALTETVADPRRAPRSLTVHYTTAPDEGTLALETHVERAGRSLTTCSARITQDDRLVGLALGAFAAARPGPAFCDLAPPPVASPDELDPLPSPFGAPAAAPPPPIARRWETRWAIGSPPLPGAERAGEAVHGMWIRLPERRVVDAAVAAAITDAAIPPVFSRVDVPIFVPTVDLTIHFRSALPRPGVRPDDWVLAVFRTGAVADGYLEEDGEVWSADGTLLAQSRQLAAVLPIPG
jgi:acyl-CoA thioesterase